MIIDPVVVSGGSSDGDESYSSSPSVGAAVRGELSVTTAFQPIVSLADQKVAGYEALSRWPRPGGGLIPPESVFLAAAVAGAEVLGDLDRRCIRAAAAAAVTANLPRGALLLINTEPATTPVTSIGDTERWLAGARNEYQVVFEFTERGLPQHPRALLAKVTALRDAGIGIAVDDVGRDPDVLAWLDVIDPDIIKLDMSLIQQHPAPDQARLLTAVYGFHERSGALVVAEGIETETHLEQARAVGATLGQGYRFGAPANPVTAGDTELRVTLGRRRRTVVADSTPFELVSRHSSVRVARQSLLTAFSDDVLTQASRATDRPIVLATVQQADDTQIPRRDHYKQVVQTSSLIAVFGQDMPARLGPAVIDIRLDPDDPLCTEWTLITLGSSHTAFALFAREHQHHRGAETEPKFEFVITTDRSLVVSAAAQLLARIP